MAPTTLGMLAVGDPGLLGRIQRGRSPTLRTADRVVTHVEDWELDPGGARAPPRRAAGPRPARIDRARHRLADGTQGARYR